MVTEIIGDDHDVVSQDISDPHIAKVLYGDSLNALSVIERVLQLDGIGDEEPASDAANDDASNHGEPLASLALTVLHVPAEQLLLSALELLVVAALNLLSHPLCHDEALFLKHRHQRVCHALESALEAGIIRADSLQPIRPGLCLFTLLDELMERSHRLLVLLVVPDAHSDKEACQAANDQGTRCAQ